MVLVVNDTYLAAPATYYLLSQPTYQPDVMKTTLLKEPISG